jgi:polyhydroxybutyrate depolymerase
MKKLLLSLFALMPMLLSAQLTSHSWTYDGETREYLMYVPAIYDGTEAVPVVFCLHGLGDNMNNFANIGMSYVADTANFIVITPQALVDNLSGSTAWNSGASAFGFVLNGTVDDIGFLGTILDTLDASHNIDKKRVYSCGFSMGGFMTNRLGCEMSDRIAAIASVAGTIGSAVTCSPGRAVPACHFHGTGDGTIAYTGNQYGNDAEDLAAYWASNNNCGGTPTVTALPDLANDGYLVTHYLYDGCDDGADVELFKVDSADHEWLSPPPTNDIFYTTEIWEFFLRHTHPENVSVSETSNLTFEMYPNPSNGNVQFNFENSSTGTITVLNVLGEIVFNDKIQGINQSLELSHLENGSYLVKVSQDGLFSTRKLVIQH